MTEAMPFLQKYDITFLRPPAISDRAFVAFPNEAGQAAGTFPIFLDFFLHPCYNNFLSASGGQETRPPFLFVYSCQE